MTLTPKDRDISLFFGSSLINTFALAQEERFRINRFKGATAKGIGQDNNNSRMIWNIVTHKYSNESPEAIIWMFGSIDCKFSYYYKLCTEHNIPDPQKTMIECATKYIHFVSKVHTFFKGKGTKTIIIGAEPNGSPPCKTYEQCVHYCVIPETQDNKQKILESIQTTHPDQLRQIYNNTLVQLCSENGFEYISIDDKLVNPGVIDLNTSIVIPDFTDILDMSVHLNWEANLLFYKEKLKDKNFAIETKLDLTQSRQAYLEEKTIRIKREKKYYLCRGIDSEPLNHKCQPVPPTEATHIAKKIKFIKFVPSSDTNELL